MLKSLFINPSEILLSYFCQCRLDTNPFPCCMGPLALNSPLISAQLMLHFQVLLILVWNGLNWSEPVRGEVWAGESPPRDLFTAVFSSCNAGQVRCCLNCLYAGGLFCVSVACPGFQNFLTACIGGLLAENQDFHCVRVLSFF